MPLVKLPPGALIHGELAGTIIDGIPAIQVHGPSGPLTSVIAIKDARRFVLPSSTLLGVSPGKHFVAWDGEGYVLRQSQENVLQDSTLTLVGAVEVPENRSGPFFGRPPLHPLTCEQIDALLYKVDQRHWPTITEMRVKRFYQPDEPVPPPMPQHLYGQILWYASMLFGTEADQYEQFRSHHLYSRWLSQLSERVVRRVGAALTTLDGGDPDTLLLGYHGLAWPSVKIDLQKNLAEIALQYEHGIAPSQRRQERPGVAAKADAINASILPRQSGAGSPTEVREVPIGELIKRLRDESLLTNEKLAAALGVDRRSVVRHISGANRPSKEHIEAYERLFTKKLGREVRLRNVPPRDERP